MAHWQTLCPTSIATAGADRIRLPCRTNEMRLNQAIKFIRRKRLVQRGRAYPVGHSSSEDAAPRIHGRLFWLISLLLVLLPDIIAKILCLAV